MIPDLLTPLAGGRCFTDVHGISEIKNNGAHLSRNLLLWRFARKDCTSTTGFQSAAALVTLTMPSDLSVSESFLTFIEQLNDPGSSCLALHELLYLTNQTWEVVF